MTDWTEMRPAHFDAALLPARHRKAEPEGLFSVADIAPPQVKTGKPQEQIDGQEDLFGDQGEQT
jgi:hypothetical protein